MSSSPLPTSAFWPTSAGSSASSAAAENALHELARKEEQHEYRGHACLVEAVPVLIVDDGTAMEAVLTYMPDETLTLAFSKSSIMLRLRSAKAGTHPVTSAPAVTQHILMENTQLSEDQVVRTMDNGSLIAACYLLINDEFDAMASELTEDINSFRVVDVRQTREKLEALDYTDESFSSPPTARKAPIPPSAPVRPAVCKNARTGVLVRGKGRLFKYEGDSSGDEAREDVKSSFSSDEDSESVGTAQDVEFSVLGTGAAARADTDIDIPRTVSQASHLSRDPPTLLN